MTLILIGSIISIIGGLIGAYATFNQNKKSSATSGRIESGVKEGITVGKNTQSEVSRLQEQNLELDNRIQSQTKTIDSLRKENTELYSKLSNASIEIYNSLTGGEAMPILSIFIEPYKKNNFFNPDYGVVKFRLVNRNKFPVRNIKLKILDFYSNIDKVKKDTDGSFSFLPVEKDVTNHFKIKEIETLPMSMGVVEVLESRFPNALEKFEYSIELRWLNGILMYNIEGGVDQKTQRIKITKVTVWPSPEKFNPFDYVEIYSEFVGGELLKYPNPF